MEFIWLTLRTNVGRVCETHMCVLRKGNPVFTGRSSSMGWPIWWLSGPLSEVCLSAQDFAIPMIDAAGKLGVLLSRCHPGSTASKWHMQAEAQILQEKLQNTFESYFDSDELILNVDWIPSTTQTAAVVLSLWQKAPGAGTGSNVQWMELEEVWGDCHTPSHSLIEPLQRGLWLALLPFYH